jgi:hypothetical protein
LDGIKTLTKRFHGCYLCRYGPSGVVTVTSRGGANRKSKTIDRLQSIKRKELSKEMAKRYAEAAKARLRVHLPRVPPTLVRAAPSLAST